MAKFLNATCFCIIFFFSCSNEENEYNVFLEIFGNGGTEEFNHVIQSYDGGYVVVGRIITQGKGADMWFIKTDSDGNEVWDKKFGGSLPYIEVANHVHQTPDGGYTILGFKSLPQGMLTSQDEVWLIKTDANGNGEWNYLYGTAIEDGDDQIGVCHQPTSDGGYIILGDTKIRQKSDIFLLKIDCHGNQEWSKSFGGTLNDYGVFIQQTYDGGYIFIGNTMSYGSGGQDIILIKTDLDGNQEWYKTFGGESYEYAEFILIDPNGGYVFGGSTNSFGNGNFDAWIIKTDDWGNLEWEITYGNDGYDWASECILSDNGDYFIGGTITIDDIPQLFLINIDGGSIKWEKKDIIEEKIYFRSFQKTSDGGFIIAGSSREFGGPSIGIGNPGGVLIKTDSDGNTISY